MTVKRIRHYDIAKGIGIILVVIGHSMIEFGHYLIYMFHMPLFFFLSGVFSKSGTHKEILRRQSQRLLLPLLIFSAIVFAIAALAGEYAEFSPRTPHFNGLVGPLWFLLALFIVAIMYNLLEKFIGKRPFILTGVAVILSIIGYVADMYKLPNFLYI